jgi:hypothetical protein
VGGAVITRAQPFSTAPWGVPAERVRGIWAAPYRAGRSFVPQWRRVAPVLPPGAEGECEPLALRRLLRLESHERSGAQQPHSFVADVREANLSGANLKLEPNDDKPLPLQTSALSVRTGATSSGG